MADLFSKTKRSQIMAAISGKNTKPEIIVRHRLFKEGFRYRKNVKTLPGKPDILLPKYETAILIHGCFWHGHSCKRGTKPVSNVAFWNAKIKNNISRDKRIHDQLIQIGWQVITVWDCELKNKEVFERTMLRIIQQLKNNNNLINESTIVQ